MNRKLILSLIASGASLALCPALHAQDATPTPDVSGTNSGMAWGKHHGAHGAHGETLEKLTTALDLTADQQAKIKPVLDDAHSQMMTMRQDTSMSQDDKMAKMKDVWTNANSQIEAVLTPDQQTKFAALKQQMHNHRHPGADSSPSPSATP